MLLASALVWFVLAYEGCRWTPLSSGLDEEFRTNHGPLRDEQTDDPAATLDPASDAEPLDQAGE